MSKTKLNQYFDIRELVPKEVWEAVGMRIINALHVNSLPVLTAIRELSGEPVTINTWLWGGHWNYRGLRMNTNVGAKYSAHKGGYAYDINIGNWSAKEMYAFLNSLPLGTKEYILRVEDPNITKTWLHLEICFYRQYKQGEQIPTFKV